jgi:hypothetical protein
MTNNVTVTYIFKKQEEYSGEFKRKYHWVSNEYVNEYSNKLHTFICTLFDKESANIYTMNSSHTRAYSGLSRVYIEYDDDATGAFFITQCYAKGIEI